MSNRPLRKRIPYRKPIGLELIPDDLEFVSNKSSNTARKIIDIDHNLTIELWYDKHYYERHFFGDEMGRREGIDPVIIEECIKNQSDTMTILYYKNLKTVNF